MFVRNNDFHLKGNPSGASLFPCSYLCTIHLYNCVQNCVLIWLNSIRAFNSPKARRTKSRGPEGRQLKAGPRGLLDFYHYHNTHLRKMIIYHLHLTANCALCWAKLFHSVSIFLLLLQLLIIGHLSKCFVYIWEKL